MDGGSSEAVEAVAAERGLELIRIGRAGKEIRICDIAPEGFRQRLAVDAFGKRSDILLPLAGAFQASNALVAAGLAIGAGIEPAAAFDALASLEGAPGRLELVGRKANGALVFVDYAHKPDALASALDALRPMTAGRLIVVFGAGGDRDPGQASADGRRPRPNGPTWSSSPTTIRAARIRPRSAARSSTAAPGAIEIGDRGEAIRRAIAMLEPGDVLCVAGKGHETGQIVGGETFPFSDHRAVGAALAAEEAA